MRLRRKPILNHPGGLPELPDGLLLTEAVGGGGAGAVGAGFGAAADAGLPALPLLFALAGALLSALAYVSVRALRSSEHPLVVVFYFPLMALPLSLPLVLLQPVAPTAAELGWLLGVGVFTQLGQIALTYGLVGMAAARATAIS